MNRVVAVDPGRNKCGLVLTDADASLVLEGRVVSASSVIDLIIYWHEQAPLKGLVLGNGTSSKYWEEALIKVFPVEVVEEKGTTLRARQRYWELWPPMTWRRLIPRGLILPPHDLDAVAALLLLEDHLGKKFRWPGPHNFKT